MIDKVIKSGDALMDCNHFAAVTIKENCQELSLKWSELFDGADEREERLNMAFEAQQVRVYSLSLNQFIIYVVCRVQVF